MPLTRPTGGIARAPHGARALGVRAALGYLGLGAVWVVASDRVVEALVDDPVGPWVQTVKGLAFVTASAALMFLFIRGFARGREVIEADLRSSEARYRTLVERVPGVVYVNLEEPDDRLHDRVLYMGPQIEQLTGYPPETFRDDPRQWPALVHPLDRDRFFEATERSNDTGEPFSLEYRLVTRDGRTVWVNDQAVLVLEEDGTPAFWQGVLVDITPQRAVEAQLHELGESLRGVFMASPLAIMVLEPDGRVRHWNPAAERMLGWTADEVIGRPLPYVPEDKLEEFRALRERVLAGEAFSGVEVTRDRKDGSTVEVSLSTAPIRGEDGDVVAIAAVLEDITERRAAEEAFARRARQQEAIAGLGVRALAGGPLAELFDEAMKAVGETLGVDLVALLEPEEAGGALVLRAGIGWDPGLVGTHLVPAGTPSLASYTLEQVEPVIIQDLASEWRFPPPPNLTDHGVVSGVSVVVHAGGIRPYGTLEALSRTPSICTRDDVHFLRTVSALIGFAIDRERAEAAIRAAEERFRQLVEAGPGVVYVHDGKQAPPALTYVSPQVVDLLGYPHETWERDPLFWLECIHPEDRKRVLRADERAIGAGAPIVKEYRFVAADGREVWVADRATVIRDDHGAPLLWQGLLVDVTERVRAEEERSRAIESQLRLATRLEALHQVDRDVLSATSIEQMADRALEHLRLLVHYDRATVGFVDGETGVYTALAERRPGGLDSPLLGQIPDEAVKALLATEVLSIAELGEFDAPTPLADAARAMGIRSVLSVALLAEGEQLGNLTLASRSPHAFGEEAEDIAKEVASQLAIATRQARLRDALQERADQLGRVADERRQLLHRIVRAQEEERERVALELHDGIGQILTSVSLFASDLERDVPEGARPRVERVNELIRQAIEDSRQLVWSLRPPELERLGLVPALRRLAEDASGRGDVCVDLHEDIGGLRLEPESEAVVYRVVQEALHNAQKHARASDVSILLRRNDRSLSALIEDNGRGFDPAAIPVGRGLGLIGMRERAELVGGALILESREGSGTRVRLEVPVGAGREDGDGC